MESETEVMMASKPFWFFFAVSIIAAVSTQQVLIENPEGKSELSNVGKNLRFKIDTAKLTIQRSSDPATTIEDINLSLLSDICYKCAYYSIGKLDRHHTNTTILVDTRWPLTIKFETSKCNVLLYEHFGEYGEYDVHLHLNATGGCNITDIQTLQSPINSMIPILVAFCIFLALALLYTGLEYLWMKRMQSDSEDITPIIRQENQEGEVNIKPADADDEQDRKVTSFTKTPTSKPRERLKSIDTFRGLCLVVMIFVNFRGGYYWFFRHSKWNGLTVADLVFPWFMFLMGVNIPLSLESLLRRDTPPRQIAYKAIRRTLILFALGLFIINHNTSWSTIRIPGVLQRFSIAYIVAFMLQWPFHIRVDDMEMRLGESRWRPLREIICYWPHWLSIILLETLWLCITFLLPVPGCPTGYIGAGGLADDGKYNKSCVGGAAGYIDRWLFTESHMYGHPTCKNVYYPTLSNDEKVPFDPEGVLGSINGCVMVLLGCQAGKIFLYYKSAGERITRWLSWSLLLGIISIILCKASMNDGWIPVNKNLWSTTYVTTLASMGFFLLALFYGLIDVLKIWSGRPLDFVGMNSILLYVGHEVFSDYVPFSWGITEHASHAQWISMNLLGVSYWVIIAYYCYTIKFFLKI